MKQLRIERKKLTHITEINESKGAKTAVGMTPDMVLKQQQEQNSSILEMEKKRIQKMKERQERELEQMLQVGKREGFGRDTPQPLHALTNTRPHSVTCFCLWLH